MIVIDLVLCHALGIENGWRRYSFHVFKTIFIVLLYHKERATLTWLMFGNLRARIDESFISVPFIDFAIFLIEWIKSGVEVPADQVPTEQAPCYGIGIFN